MYTVTITRDFVAQHFLIGGDWGAENQWHSHHYQVEVRLEGEPQAIGAAGGNLNLEALEAQAAPQETGDRWVVIDDQHARACGPETGAASGF